MVRVLAAICVFVLWPMGAATAKVQQTGPNGFAISHEATVKLSPAEAYDAFLKIGSWWDKSHTFSGDPKNITIDAKPGGCWCEALPKGGFVKHMEFASAVPAGQLVFRGGLGPLHFMGATGAMTVKFAAMEGGTKVSLTYHVTGYDPDGFNALGPAVDGVLGQQLAHYAARMGQ